MKDAVAFQLISKVDHQLRLNFQVVKYTGHYMFVQHQYTQKSTYRSKPVTLINCDPEILSAINVIDQ